MKNTYENGKKDQASRGSGGGGSDNSCIDPTATPVTSCFATCGGGGGRDGGNSGWTKSDRTHSTAQVAKKLPGHKRQKESTVAKKKKMLMKPLKI